MRKSHEKVCRAFLAGERAGEGSLATNGQELWLHGNTVAKHDDGLVVVSNAGYHTALTRNVLNALALCAGSKLALRIRRNLMEVWHPHQERWLTMWSVDIYNGEWYVL